MGQQDIFFIHHWSSLEWCILIFIVDSRIFHIDIGNVYAMAVIQDVGAPPDKLASNKKIR